MEELKGNLRGLVEIRKESMNSSAKGLRKVNEKIVVQKAQPISSVPPLLANSNKKTPETSSQGVDTQVTTGPYTRTRRINYERRATRFIMEELKEIHKNVI